jgi:hypothetical protein
MFNEALIQTTDAFEGTEVTRSKPTCYSSLLVYHISLQTQKIANIYIEEIFLLSKIWFAIPVVFLWLAGSKFRLLQFAYSCSPVVHISGPVSAKQLESSMFHPSLSIYLVW